jgi:hypothetical protein
VPFKAFDGVIDALSRTMRHLPRTDAAALVPRNAALLPRVFPVLGRVQVIAEAPRPQIEVRDPHELRNRVFTALRELFFKLAERRPPIVVIDDLQWADPDSRLLLEELMRPPEPPPLLLLISSRETTTLWSEATTGKPTRPREVTYVHVEPLGKDAGPELARLLLERAQAAPSIDPNDIALEARGHPLFIDELVRHAVLTGGEDRRRLRLDEAIWARVATLPDAARRVLELVVVAGTPILQDTLGDASDLGAEELTRQVSRLRVANLVRGRGGRGAELEAYHDRVRAAVLAHVDVDAQRAHHRRLAIALKQAGADIDDPQVLVSHFEAAGDALAAARHAEEAADRAARSLAFDRAAELYRTALRLGELAPDRARTLRFRLGETLANAGRGLEAAEVFLAAAEDAPPGLRLECQRQASEQLLISGHIERGLEALASLLGDIGLRLPATPQRALVSLLWQRLKLRLRGLGWTERDPSEISAQELTRIDVYKVVAHGLGMVDTIRGADFQARVVLLALRTGERTRVGRGIATEACYVANQGTRHLPRARRLAEAARVIADQCQEPYLLAWTRLADGVVGFFGGEFRASAAACAEAEAKFRDETVGSTWELNGVRLFRLFALRNHGAFREAGELFQSYVRDATQRGDRYVETSMRRYCSFLWLAAADPDGARQNLALATWVPPEGAYHLQHWFELEALAEIALYEDRAAAARVELAPSFRRLDKSLLLRVQNVRCLAHWLRARFLLQSAAQDGAPGRALAEARTLARRLDGERIAYAGVFAELIRAGAAARANPEAAAAALRAAADAADATDMQVCAAVARRRLGALIGGDTGADLVKRADHWLAGEGVADPERLTAIYAPG